VVGAVVVDAVARIAVPLVGVEVRAARPRGRAEAAATTTAVIADAVSATPMTTTNRRLTFGMRAPPRGRTRSLRTSSDLGIGTQCGAQHCF
jgi:hypothetical protein